MCRGVFLKIILPAFPFRSPYRTVGALVHANYDAKAHGAGMEHHHHAHSHGQSQAYNSYPNSNRDKDDSKFEGMMLKYFIEQAVKDAMSEDDDNDKRDMMGGMKGLFRRKYFGDSRYVSCTALYTVTEDLI